MTNPLKAVASTPTAQLRRVTIPKHRRVIQVQQTVSGVVVGALCMALVYVLHAPMVWYLVSFLFGLRIASKELLLDCLKIARESIGLFGGRE